MSELLVLLLVGLAVGGLAGWWFHRYRWWWKRQWTTLRWHLYQRWRQDRITVRRTELLYLLRVNQHVEGRGRYNAEMVVSESILKEDMGLSWVAGSLDNKLLADLGVVLPDREWTMALDITSMAGR